MAGAEGRLERGARKAGDVRRLRPLHLVQPVFLLRLHCPIRIIRVQRDVCEHSECRLEILPRRFEPDRLSVHVVASVKSHAKIRLFAIDFLLLPIISALPPPPSLPPSHSPPTSRP